MDWMEEVRENLKKRRQILFSKDAACLQPLADSKDRKSVV